MVPAQAGEPDAEGQAAEANAPAATEPPVVDPAQAARRAGRRELTITVLIALLGGIIAWASAGRPWATGLAGVAPNTLKVTASGDDLSAGVTALGLAALAGALALFATQRLARRLVGVLLIAAGVGVAVYAFGERGASHASRVLADKAAAKGYATRSMDAHMASWWTLAAVGGVLVVLAGVVAAVRGATWPGMSSRYENAATKAAARAADTGTAKDLWDALDRGEDPTELVEPAGVTPAATTAATTPATAAANPGATPAAAAAAPGATPRAEH
ncbi:putative membrane protein (TIGR02234 family) [Catenulispora sp. EB89]|uniref:Trp biosynthesis-associated membrane protein n=1 Tax=Catenulispora sp. EB89 TaxID=3156257 RepID=UPI003514C56C